MSQPRRLRALVANLRDVPSRSFLVSSLRFATLPLLPYHIFAYNARLEYRLVDPTKIAACNWVLDSQLGYSGALLPYGL